VPNLVVNVVLIAVTPSVDAHFVGQLGLDSFAGLALVFPLMMLMQQMANMAMGGAIAASIARAIGADVVRTQPRSWSMRWRSPPVPRRCSARCSCGRARHLPRDGRPGTDPGGGARIFNVIFAGAFAFWLLGALRASCARPDRSRSSPTSMSAPSSCISRWCPSSCSVRPDPRARHHRRPALPP
jgi:hypothetical protein